MNKWLAYFYCASLLCCTEVNAMHKSMENSSISSLPDAFLSCPKLLIQHILSFVSEDGLTNLRMVSKGMEKNVKEAYKKKLNTQFGNKTYADLKDLLTDSHEPFLAPFNDNYGNKIKNYKNKIMEEVCTEYLDKDGYVFVSQGSLLEGYLSLHYKSVPLYDYLQEKDQETKDLFKAFFGKDLPEGKKLLGLKLLTACLPANHIYVKQDTKKTEYSELLGKFQSRLLQLQSIQGNKRKYFFCGIDKESTLSEEDVIVINQSDWHLESFSYLDNSSVDRTIIYNADQEELSFSNPPKNMKNLILVNGDNRCVRIGDEFLIGNQNLQSCSLKGLTSVQTIGDKFLFFCRNLFTFDTKGMTNVQTIKGYFLSHCGNLQAFDSKGMTNVETIGCWFLAECENLQAFDSKGMTNVRMIETWFLYGCENLQAFDSKGMTSVEIIKDSFLSGCKNLLVFDSKGMISVWIIGSSFLADCKNLHVFDSKGMTSVRTIENFFLDRCPKLNGDKIKEEILKSKRNN